MVKLPHILLETKKPEIVVTSGFREARFYFFML